MRISKADKTVMHYVCPKCKHKGPVFDIDNGDNFQCEACKAIFKEEEMYSQSTLNSLGRKISSLNRQLRVIKLASIDNQDEMYSHCMFLVGDLAGKPNEQLEYIKAYIAELSGRDLSEALAAAQKYIDDCDKRANQAYKSSKEVITSYKSKINKKAGYWEEDSEAAEASGKKTLAKKIGDPKKINQAWATPEGNTEFFNHVNKLKTELEEARKNNLKKTDVGYISDPEAYKVYLAKKDELYNFLAQYPFKEECNKCWGRGGKWGHGDFFGCEHCDETGYMFPTLEKVNHDKAMDEAHGLAENKHREWKRQKREDLEDRLDTSERYPDKEYNEPEVEEEEE